MKPFFSIITPSYNLGSTIEKTIKSVLHQTYQNFEYIVVDGASTDDTLKILKKFASNSKYKNKFRYISEKDKGQTDAINKGFKLASGDWVSWINADDFLEPETLKIVRKSVNNSKKKLGVVYGKCRTIHKNKIVIDKPPKSLNKNKLFSYSGNVIFQPSSFLNSSMLKKIGYLDNRLRYWMDLDVFLKLSKISNFKYIDKILANFLAREDRKSQESKLNSVIENRLVFMKNSDNKIKSVLANRIIDVLKFER